MPSTRQAKKTVKNAVLPDLDMLYISNFLTNEAVRCYSIQFKQKVVPFKFINFFFDSLKQSSALNKDEVFKTFCKECDSSQYDIYCYVYYLTFLKYIKKIRTNKANEKFFVLKSTTPSVLSTYVKESSQAKCLELLQSECDIFASQGIAFIQTAYSLYCENFKDYLSLAADKNFVDKKTQKGSAIRKTSDSAMLQGSTIELPAVEPTKKVHKLFIPSLKLPTHYPVSKSRIHSAYYVNKITALSTQVDFLLKERISSVKYTQSFIDLRTDASKTEPPKPQTRRNWDDFF